MSTDSPVLILGAGINGAALARELVLNGVAVTIVDTRDIAAGTTAYSSRLIHGGLRYLEYGDFSLVRESLAERTRWLRLAPHLVRPLRLFIPVRNRFGGLLSAARNFLGVKATKRVKPCQRGLWTVRLGLWFYDRYARDRSLPKSRANRVDAPHVPPIDRATFRWLCEYSDAQLRFPERFTIELLTDARQIAAQQGIAFAVHTYHRAIRDGHDITIQSIDHPTLNAARFRPAAIINATGSWVDMTLSELGISTPKLMGGTKGSHFVTGHAELRRLLERGAVYAEAADGRPVFILPFGDSTLVGTTDEAYIGDPDDALASDEELNYLVGVVNQIFPQAALTRNDIEIHYCGVRPLPRVDASSPAAISRRHWLEEHASPDWPLYSIIGGKLTTCRSLAQNSAATILQRLGRQTIATSQDRPLPGATLPGDSEVIQHDRYTSEQMQAVSELFGNRASEILRLGEKAALQVATTPFAVPTNPPNANLTEMLDGTLLPIAVAHYAVRHEWAERLDDLVERRLMLLYHRPLTRRCLQQLTDVLVAHKKLRHEQGERQLQATIERLARRFGKRVVL